MNYIGYYRRSKKQYASTLGLESQQAAVQQYVSGKGELLHQYTEIESGTCKNRGRRTVIKEAIAKCLETGATLVIAKLDRLARDVSFTADLMQTRVKFIALDIPDANELTIHIMAAMAEHEAKRISERITAALAVKRSKGEALGIHTHKDSSQTLKNGFGVVSLNKARSVRSEAAKTNLNNQRARGYARALREQGLGLGTIASKMNGERFTSPSGKEIKCTTVSRWINA